MTSLRLGFHLVQKGRELHGLLATIDECERAEAEARRETAAQQRRDGERETMATPSALLAQFDQVASIDDPHQRGYFLEDLPTSLS